MSNTIDFRFWAFPLFWFLGPFLFYPALGPEFCFFNLVLGPDNKKTVLGLFFFEKEKGHWSIFVFSEFGPWTG